MSYRVSIIIPFINEYAYLRDALRSAMDQKLPNAEIIVVCNDTRPVDEGLQKEFTGITWLQEPERGSAHARNKGWKHASGEWIQFLDVDDVLRPDKIKHQLPEDNDSVVVSPHLFSFLDGRSEKSKWLPDDVWTGILDSGLGSTSSMLWSKKALQLVGGWSADFQSHQEYELLSRMAMAGVKIHMMDRVETIVRQRTSGSITITSNEIRPLEGIRVRENLWNYMTEHGLATPARRDAFLQYIFRQLRGLYRQDPQEAINIYKKHFLNSVFTPHIESIPGYHQMYRRLGFEKTEKLLRTYRSLREKYLHFLPKNN